MDWDLRYKKLLIEIFNYVEAFLLIGVLGCTFLIVFGKHETQYYLMWIEWLIGFALGIIVGRGLVILTLKEDVPSLLNVKSNNLDAQIKYLEFQKQLKELEKKE